MDILLVEDSRSDASLFTDFIAEEDKNPVVHWIADGYAALDYIFRQGQYQDAAKPDIIMLDLALPRLGGYEVLKKLKDSSCADIPVIVLTTSDNPIDCRNCLGLGAAAFFSKPYNLQGYEDLAQQLIHAEFPRLVPSAAQESPPVTLQ